MLGKRSIEMIMLRLSRMYHLLASGRNQTRGSSCLFLPEDEAFLSLFPDVFFLLRDFNFDLSNLFTNAAIQYIENHGGKVYLKSRIENIEINNNQVTSVTAKIDNEEETFKTSKVIIATAPQNIKKIITDHSVLDSINNKIEQFNYEPIVTVYLQYSEETRLTQSMLGLSSTLSQWAFDRGVFCNQSGLISVVISCNGQHMTMDDDTLAQAVHDEISTLFTSKPTLIKSFVIREKRATFACSVNINNIRPQNETDVKGLFIAGDYTDTHYPATLEGAVRSGLAASNLIK